MSSLITSLKSEIARVARKELKQELLSMRKLLTGHRSEIAALKRQVKAQAVEIKSVKRGSKGAAKAAAEQTTDKPRAVRYSATRFAAMRKRFGITQAQLASLLGASALSVHKWEAGAVRPRAAQLERISQIAKLGKREVKARLQAA